MKILKRIGAFFIDIYIISFLLIIITIILAFLVDSCEIGIDNYNSFITGVYIILIVLKDIPFKRSLGKRILKLKIVKTRTTDSPSIISIILRNITFLIFPIEAILFVIIYKGNSRLGDLLAKTEVIEQK